MDNLFLYTKAFTWKIMHPEAKETITFIAAKKSIQNCENMKIQFCSIFNISLV